MTTDGSPYQKGGRALPAIVIVAFAAFGLLLFFTGDRYALVAQNGDKYVYKIDKRTGRVWLIWGDILAEIQDRDAHLKTQTPEEQAISLANLYTLPGNTSVMRDSIKQWLQAKKGLLRVYGWNAKKIDDQTYLVGYTYDEGPGSSGGGWVFEVNLKEDIVRNVTGDADLEKRYADWAQKSGEKR
jgi:hypothetical protein